MKKKNKKKDRKRKRKKCQYKYIYIYIYIILVDSGRLPAVEKERSILKSAVAHGQLDEEMDDEEEIGDTKDIQEKINESGDEKEGQNHRIV